VFVMVENGIDCRLAIHVGFRLRVIRPGCYRALPGLGIAVRSTCRESHPIRPR
jgi:hypothetical protein